jgi:hypothetical protein
MKSYNYRSSSALPLRRVIVAFRKYEEQIERLLEYHFCSLTLHIPNREPNGEPFGAA